MATVTMTYAREHFAELCERVHFKDETIVVTKGKSERVAIIPVKSLELLEQVEQAIDLARAQQSLESIRHGEDTVSLEEIRQALGIKENNQPTGICR